MIVCISVLSVVMSPFSFLILLILVFSFFLDESCQQFVNFIFSKNQLLVLLTCYYLLHFFFIYFCSNLYDFFGVVGVVLFLVALGVRLGCLFEVSLIS